MSKESSMTKLDQFEADNLNEDVNENIEIANHAIDMVYRKYKIKFSSPRLVLGYYNKVYGVIKETLLSKRAKNSEYRINIANIVEIGYTDGDKNEELEKMGSFVPYIMELNGHTNNEEEPGENSLEKCVQWNSKNIKEQKKIINEISVNAVKVCSDELDLTIGNPEIIIPVWVTIHEAMVNVMKLKLIDSKSFEIMVNFAGAFDVYCRKTDNGSDIEFSPMIEDKLDTKSDIKSSSKYE